MKIKKSIVLALAAIGLAAPGGVLASTYNGTTVPPASDGKTYTINASAGDSLTLTDVGQAGNQLGITFANNVSGTVTIEKTATRPASASSNAPGTALTYYDVTLSGFTNADIQSHVWKFGLSNSELSGAGLAAANIRMYHFAANTWTALPTQVTTASSTTTNFSATGKDFSPFAVAGTAGLPTAGSLLYLGVFLGFALIVAVTVGFKLSRS